MGAVLGLCLYLAAATGVQRWFVYQIYGEPWLLRPFCALAGALLLRELRLRLDQDRLLQAMADAGGAQAGSPAFLKSPCLRPLERQLQEMSRQVQQMVEQNMRGERLKVDLITNVSHDLKPPLTSMITYIRLMQKENDLPEKDARYLQVLSEKSLQLKRLTEDLLDAAKITSGNETASPERLDFGEMVRQANGEFAEALEARGLQLVSQLPEGLMERFVQGDTSRSSGGNGLGLAIARDLARLQGGKLELEIVGDLFLARLTVPAAAALSRELPG